MTTVKSATELREELAAKSKSLDELFTEALTDSGGHDFTRVKSLSGDQQTRVDEVQRRTKEINALHDEFKKAEGNERAHREAKALHEFHNEPASGMQFPGGANKSQAQAPMEQKSLGELFTESAQYKAWRPGRKTSEPLEIDTTKVRLQPIGTQMKALLETSTGYAPDTPRSGRLVPYALRRPVVADLIPQTNTTLSAITYMEQTTATNAADTVAEGGLKPESTLAWTEKSSPVRKIATVLPVTDEQLADVPGLRGIIDAQLRLFLQLKEEDKLISGSATPPSLTGMLNTPSISTQAKGADPTPDAVYKAMTKIRTLAFLEPSGAIFNPNDWQDVRLLRTVDGIYIWGSPMDPGPERIWGVPVVVTPAMTENTAIVAAFDTGMFIYRRQEITIDIANQNEDDFIYNKLIIRIEERLAFVVQRPKAICTVTGV